MQKALMFENSGGDGSGGENQWGSFFSMPTVMNNLSGASLMKMGPDFGADFGGGGGGGGTAGGGGYPAGGGYPIGAAQAGTPGMVPPQSYGPSQPVSPSTSPYTPYAPSVNSQYSYGSTYDPNFTANLENFLAGRIGQGVTPFNLSALMPSSGGVTQPGQLTADNNTILRNLMQAFSSGDFSGIQGLNTLSQASQTGLPTNNSTLGMFAGNGQAATNSTLQQMAQSGLLTNNQTLNDIAKNGNPIDQTPAWQAMVDSMQRQIQQGATNLKEQFNFGGGLAGTPFGNSMSDYFTQTSKDLNAQLLAAQTGALESAAGRQLTAGQDIAGLSEAAAQRMLSAGSTLGAFSDAASGRQFAAGQSIAGLDEAAKQRMMTAGQDITGLTTQLGSLFQGLDQSSIDRLLNEFVRTSPESNPLLNAQYGIATTFPPYLAKQSGITGLGATIGNIGSIAGLAGAGLGAGISGTSAAGGALGTLAGILGAICWVSRALFGDDSVKVPVIRRFMVHWAAKSDEGMKLLRWYVDNGAAIAALIHLDARLKALFTPLFNQFFLLGVSNAEYLG